MRHARLYSCYFCHDQLLATRAAILSHEIEWHQQVPEFVPIIGDPVYGPQGQMLTVATAQKITNCYFCNASIAIGTLKASARYGSLHSCLVCATFANGVPKLPKEKQDVMAHLLSSSSVVEVNG